MGEMILDGFDSAGMWSEHGVAILMTNVKFVLIRWGSTIEHQTEKPKSIRELQRGLVFYTVVHTGWLSSKIYYRSNVDPTSSQTNVSIVTGMTMPTQAQGYFKLTCMPIAHIQYVNMEVQYSCIPHVE